MKCRIVAAYVAFWINNFKTILHHNSPQLDFLCKLSYKGEEADKECGVFAELIVGIAAEITELLKLYSGLVPIVDNIRHVSSQHKGCSVPMEDTKMQIMRLVGSNVE